MRDDAKKVLYFARAQLGAGFEFAEREKASAGAAGAGGFGLALVESREGREGREMKLGELVRSAWLRCSRAYVRETR